MRQDLRSNMIDSQQCASSYCSKGVHFGTDQAQAAAGVAVNLAIKGVSVMAANTERMERAAKLNALARLNCVAMPIAELVIKVAERIIKAATRKAGTIIAETVTKTSKAARRAARKAEATAIAD